MHTALVVSMGILLAIAGDPRHEEMANHGLQAIVMLLDFPVTILTIPAVRLEGGRLHARVVGGSHDVHRAWRAPMVPDRKPPSPLDMRIRENHARCLEVIRPCNMAGILLVIGCGGIPWVGHWEWSSHAGATGP